VTTCGTGLYRRKVAKLIASLSAENGAGAHEFVRSLVEEIRLILKGDTQRVEVRGDLATLPQFGPAIRACNSGKRRGQQATAWT
jgi:hypothetical protein